MNTNKIRSLSPDKTIDQLEENWWNKNAQVIEAIWALPENIRLAVREHYLKRAKSFFISSNKKPLQVIEIGCGSGWVGRIIAEPDIINIIGLDLSEQQIQIANQKAIEAGIAETCEYHCQNLADFVLDKNSSYNCVLIHAILHHLSWQEIHNIFSQISLLGSGTKIFVYEPVYLPKPSHNKTFIWRVIRKIIRPIIDFPSWLGQMFTLRVKESYNKDLAEQLDYIFEESSQNNWFFSPKEIVFEESELLETLEKYCEIHDRYLCNHTSVTVGQLAAMYDNTNLHQDFCQTVLPLSRYIDKYLFTSGLLSRVHSGFVFMGYECILK